MRGLFMAVDKKRVLYFFNFWPNKVAKSIDIAGKWLKLVHLPGLKVVRSELIEDLLQVKMF